MTAATDHAPLSFETFRVMIADALQANKEDIVPEASFTEDLHADSLQLVEMMIHLQESGVAIPIESA